MIASSDLKWGQTPFDDLSREELLDSVRAYHLALTAARHVMYLFKSSDRDSPFWKGPSGTGGRAMQLADVLMARIGDGEADERSESIYRCYFRYAEQVLFPELLRDRRSEWWLNSEGHLTGGEPSREMLDLMGWRDDFRLMNADDLKPHPDVDNEEASAQ